MKVTAENVFSVPANFFGISGSNEGYTLNYSVNGDDWAEWDEATPANQTLFVANCPKFMKYKLVGNNSEIEVKW